MRLCKQNQIQRPFRALLTLPLFFVLSVLPILASAQQTMTVEELENYIEEQKAALAQVEANRAETAQKAEEINTALEEQQARRAEIEAEFKSLCEEQEKLKPGSLDACMAALSE